ncbi:MAG: nuclear transport factor 2 family protein [Sphingobium sp.]
MKGFAGKCRSGAIVLSLALAAGPVMASETAAQKPATELKGAVRQSTIEELSNLRFNFHRSIDRHDWNGLRATVTDDFEVYFADNSGKGGTAVRPPIEAKGADNFLALVKQIVGDIPMTHVCTMPQFEYIGKDRARARWLVFGYGAVGPQGSLGFEEVIDDYVRINGKWLIRRSEARIENSGIFPRQEK